MMRGGSLEFYREGDGRQWRNGEGYTIMTDSTDPPKKKMTIIIINCISYSMPSTI